MLQKLLAYANLGIAVAILINQKKTNMKVSEAIELLKQTRDQLIKAKGEILGKIAKLENAPGDLTDEQSKVIQDLRATVQNLDDVVPDEPGAPGKPTVEDEKEEAEKKKELEKQKKEEAEKKTAQQHK